MTVPGNGSAVVLAAEAGEAPAGRCWLTDRPSGAVVQPHSQLQGVWIYECGENHPLKITYPPPSDEVLTEFYKGAHAVGSEYSAVPLGADHRMMVRGLGQHGVIMAHKPAAFALTEESAVADVGCGMGALLKQFEQYTPKLTCYEADEKLQNFVKDIELKEAMQKGAQVKGFATKESLLPNSHDLILSSHVVEHIPEPLPVLQSWRDGLKKGGLMFIEVPAEYPKIHGGILKGVGHVNFFSLPAALQMVEAVGGLEVVHAGLYRGLGADTLDASWDATTETGSANEDVLRLLLKKI